MYTLKIYTVELFLTNKVDTKKFLVKLGNYKDFIKTHIIHLKARFTHDSGMGLWEKTRMTLSTKEQLTNKHTIDNLYVGYNVSQKQKNNLIMNFIKTWKNTKNSLFFGKF